MYKRPSYSIMELILLWISKRLLKNGIIATIYGYMAILINSNHHFE